jgi:hypothetical protein
MMSDRWRNWTPKPVNPESEASKQGFEGFEGSISRDMSITPVSWGEELHRWMLARCEFKNRCFGGMNSLHRDWCEWIINTRGVVEKSDQFLSRTGFYLQISELGFFVADDLVYGLLLREFCISLEIEPSKPPKPNRVTKNETPRTFKTPRTHVEEACEDR